MMRLCLFAVVVLTLVNQFTSARAEDQPVPPRAGKYLIRSYGASNRPPLFLGSFVIEEGGKYKAYLPGGRMTGEGEFTYDKSTSVVTWTTGPYKGEWEGSKLSLSREGKTHTIYLKPRTLATSSVEDEEKK